MKKGVQYVLGLDLGTNSIGWALVEIDHEACVVRIMCIGSRIIPMDPSEISKFENGGHMVSSAAECRKFRQQRRRIERFILRRDRLNCVLDIYKMLPEHYRLEIDMYNESNVRSGKIHSGCEPKIAYKFERHKSSKRDKYSFIFKSSYDEMLKELVPLNVHNRPIPKDWTLYYLRKKALTDKISLQELSWVLHSFNKKRGYEQTVGVDENTSDNETRLCKISCINNLSNNKYEITLEDSEEPSWNFKFIEETTLQNRCLNDFVQIEIVNKYDNEGNIEDSKTLYVLNEIITLKAENRRYENGGIYIDFNNGWTYKCKGKTWKDLSLDRECNFVCTRAFDVSGNVKNTSLTVASAEDKKAIWSFLKLDTENKIEKYNHEHGTKGVASYIYAHLLSDRNDLFHTKIIGGLVESVERKYYREEIIAILETQSKFYDGLSDRNTYYRAINTLYPHNESHRGVLAQQSICQLIADDILHYQRDLKSKKSEIDDCRFEKYTFVNNGEKVTKPIKVVHTSNPYHQEFRIWKFINQLKIYENPTEEHASRLDVTDEYLSDPEVRANLFSEFQKHKTISMKVLRKSFFKLPNNGEGFSWNYGSDHEEKGNETRYEFMWRLRRIKGFDWEKFLDATHVDGKKDVSNEYMLWHFFYSVKRKSQKNVGLPNLVERLLEYAGMDLGYKSDVVKNLMTFNGYKSAYGAYSEKALLKLLPFMRCGKYRNEHEIIEVTGIVDDAVLWGLKENEALEIVYGPELLKLNKEHWSCPNDINNYLKNNLKANSLRNPVVEKVLREMLKVVHDIWKSELVKNPNFHFDEIHVEMGREMQKSKDQKQKYQKQLRENKNANKRAELILKELGYESLSPFLKEKYRIYENCVNSLIKYDKKDKVYEYKDGEVIKTITKQEIEVIQSANEISQNDLIRYRLWLDQRFTSPYTGKPISLCDLFDREKYQRDHVLPRERITLDSIQNLVMCESKVNKKKSAMTGMQFIKEYGGKIIAGHRILTETEYKEWIEHNITDDMRKEILLSENVPARFTNNQLNNTRYISRMALSLLSRIVREDNEKTAISKHLLPINGGITAVLRRDWKLGDVWNRIISPRFERMNSLISEYTGNPCTLFGEIKNIHGNEVFIPQVPEAYRDEFEKKRIDHRHHALDALVIALSEVAHVQYLNNVSGDKDSDIALDKRKELKSNHTYCTKDSDGNKQTRFLPPAQYKNGGKTVKYRYSYVSKSGKVLKLNDFEEVAYAALSEMYVSFKQNMRLMSPRRNVYLHFDADQGRIVPVSESNLNDIRKWCLRQPLSPNTTLYGLREKKGSNQKYLSTRWNHDLTSLGTLDYDKCIDEIGKIADECIQKTLKNYLEACEKLPEKAFSAEGITYLNAHISDYTPNKKMHAPILKVAMLQVSQKGHSLSRNGGVKSKQYTEANKNVVCYFYKDRIIVQTLDMLIQRAELPDNYSYTICPNDLVYVPSKKELELASKLYSKGIVNISIKDFGIKQINPNNMYKVTKFEPNGNTANVYFMPMYMAKMMIEGDKNYSFVNETGKKAKLQSEFVWNSTKTECSRTMDSNELIKETCWKITINRIGGIESLITKEGVEIKNR
ncbi:MAG: hypothetical protein KBT33_04660 [Prevotellaceae bacterium]|nr:hypothetical protein [Candidatus Minthosoma equi]